uniref:EF-hand domain-containing protein n=1 Tax=Araucaria cunninghamii TaxID=56994 RepID=A0A0D6QWU2_ARACU
MKGLGKSLFGKSGKKPSECPSPSSSRSAEGMTESQAGAVRDAGELAEVFKKFDANGDGRISASELADILRATGCQVSEAELKIMMEEADLDGDGFISLDEFIHLNTKGIGNDRKACLEDLKNAFKVFDLDRNGSISADELFQVLKGMGEGTTRQDCHDIISNVDRNGDGLVNFEEFKDMMIANGGLGSSK